MSSNGGVLSGSFIGDDRADDDEEVTDVGMHLAFVSAGPDSRVEIAGIRGTAAPAISASDPGARRLLHEIRMAAIKHAGRSRKCTPVEKPTTGKALPSPVLDPRQMVVCPACGNERRRTVCPFCDDEGWVPAGRAATWVKPRKERR